MTSRSETTTPEDFGPNVWLVDQMYRRYLESPDSVSESWQDFFEDYTPQAPHLQQANGGPDDPTDATVPTPAPPTSGEKRPGTEVDEAERPAPGREQAGKAEVPDNARLLRGIPATIARRMDESLSVPTATSVRSVPSKLLEVNRLIINNQLKRLHG